jgi:hypothetical protein
MNFPFTKGTPKQQLVMREFKKMAVNVRFMIKHYFPTKPAPMEKDMLLSNIIICI